MADHPVDHPARRLSPPLGLPANLALGALVHLLATVAYAGLSLLRLEGCALVEGLAAGWVLAVLLDLVLGCVLLASALRRTDGRWWVVLAGWGLSLVPFVVLAGAATSSVTGQPGGCG